MTPTLTSGTPDADEHLNTTLMRRFFAAVGAADRAELAACMTHDGVWHFPGQSAYGGEYHGIGGLFDGIRTVAGLCVHLLSAPKISQLTFEVYDNPIAPDWTEGLDQLNNDGGPSGV